MPELDINAMADAFASVLRHDLTPAVMVIADETGTWLLRENEEPRLLGELSDFDRIWQDMLLGHHYD